VAIWLKWAQKEGSEEGRKTREGPERKGSERSRGFNTKPKQGQERKINYAQTSSPLVAKRLPKRKIQRGAGGDYGTL